MFSEAFMLVLVVICAVPVVLIPLYKLVRWYDDRDWARTLKLLQKGEDHV
jgi:hypothetical protein